MAKTPFNSMIGIQEKQFQDIHKREWRILGRKIRQLGQEIPALIRELKLR